MVAKKTALPIVVKPAASSGSRGVSIISEREQLLPAFKDAVHHSDDGNFMLETYIEGTHHDVNGLFWKNEFYPCGIGDRYFTSIPHPVPEYGFYPTSLSKKHIEGLYAFIREGARAMGIQHGPVKGDCVVRGNELFVYEISPRFHGDIFTTNMLGFLEKLNPIYQFFQLLYNEGHYEFKDITQNPGVGGWRVITNDYEEQATLPIQGIWRNRVIHKGPGMKNNTEIGGLSWYWADNHEELIAKMGLKF